jgi:hypothetical protein
MESKMSETSEIELVKRLARLSPELAGRIERLKSNVEPLLARIYSIFPAYTDHDIPHSEHIMTILGWLLPDEIVKLSAQEMFCLLAAALLHDIGMLNAIDKVGDRESQQQIRDSHHLRSEQYVKNNYERLGLEKSEANAVGEICRSHRKINIAVDVSDIPDSRGTLMRMRLLCAAIRIADELHLTADRAPQIVVDAIQPPQDSVSHFEKHLSISGVGPLDSSEGVIQINATVQTLAQERALRQIRKEIQEKLTEVEPIFAQYNLPWKKIELKLQRRKVVERKVTLYLAQSGESDKDELPAKLEESPRTIETCLQDLTLWHYIEPGKKPGHVKLIADTYTFEGLLRQFLKTEEEIEFVLSPYLRDCIEQFAFENFCQRFDAVYDLQEKADRVLILQSSPTALYLLLFVSEFQSEPAIISRRSVLDVALLLGFLTDMFRFPQITQIRGIASAVGAIENKIENESKHLLKLLSALGPDLKRDFQDVFRDLIPPPEMKDIHSEDSLKFSITVSHPRSALKRGMSFPHLLKAAMISGESLELVGNKVQLSSEDSRMPQEASRSSPRYLIITPMRRAMPPVSATMFCRVEIDHSRKRITLFADAKRSANYFRYPVVVRMTMSPERNNATFEPSVYLLTIDVQQALQIEEMLNWFKSGDFHRFMMEIDQPELLPPESAPFVLEALSSDVKGHTVEPLLDDYSRRIIRCLAQLQDKIGERIPFPISLTAQQEEAIIELAQISNGMSVAAIRAKLLSIAAQLQYVQTTIRISTYFPNGQVESDEFLGPFPRIVPQIELEQKEKTRELAQALQKGDLAIRISQGFALNVVTLRQRIIDGFSETGERTFLPREPESGLAAQTVCQITIQPIQDKMWYREQVFHYQIRDVSAVNSILSNANHLLEQNNMEDAISELTSGLKRFPYDALIAGILGWAYYKARDLNSAYQYSLQAVDLQHKDWSFTVDFVYYNLGLCSLLLDRFEEGMSWYEKAITTGTGPVLDESIEDLEVGIMTEKPERLYALAFLYEHKGDLSKAIELYEQYLDSDTQYDKYKELAQVAVKRLGKSGQSP